MNLVSSAETQPAFQFPGDTGYLCLSDDRFPARGDGAADDTSAILAGIDAARRQGYVLFIPSGTYRISNTIRLPKGMRVIGYGETRPVFLLTTETPGWSGDGRKAVIDFAPQEGLQGNDTFYSAFQGIDIRIEVGNPSATGIRFDAAQGCYLRDIDLHLSEGNIGIERLGSEITNVRIFGGDYGIRGGTVSWQTLIMDSTFDGQAIAALEVNAVGPTMIRSTIRNTPRGIVARPGQIERIYIEDSRFENISEALVEFDHRDSGQQQAFIADSAFANVPRLIVARGGDSLESPVAPVFAVRRAAHGIFVNLPEPPGPVRAALSGVQILDTLPDVSPSDIPAWPSPQTWACVSRFGAVGDGETDDTEALRRAVAEADVLYFPRGRYRLTDTLKLRPDTALISFRPRSVEFVLKPGTPGFENPESPRAMLHTPPGGANFVTGFGFFPAHNPGAVAMHWQSGQASYLGDFWINWADRDLPRGSGQALGLWIEGGGGVFKNVCMSHFAPPTGLKISDTKIPGRMYLTSVEHKHGTEVILRNVRNWAFYAFQTEHAQPDSPDEVSLPILMEDCDNILFANLYLYRTSATRREPRYGIQAKNVTNLEIRCVRNFSLSPHPARYTLHLPDPEMRVRQREAVLIRHGEFQTL